MTSDDGSEKGKGAGNGHEKGGKYARFTEDQIEVLMKAFVECPKPDHFQRKIIMRENPVLNGIGNEQLKVWFQNRSEKGKGAGNGHEKGGKYARFTEDQIEVLMKAFVECPKPDHFQRKIIMRENPVLNGIGNEQLKVWFQNRRSREKQKKESSDLVIENRRLTEANKILMEENDGLRTMLAEQISENEQLRNKTLNLSSHITTFDLGLDRQSGEDHLEMCVMVADNNKSFLSLAEETRNEFLSKSIGNAISWVSVPGLKLDSPGVIGTVYASSTCIGVAARACATIPFEPFKTMEMLKDRPSWSRFCRKMDVRAKYPANNGGTIELIYSKYYAPTTMGVARDFWTIRYSSVLDDGSLVVCEKSISGSCTVSSSPTGLEFVRGRMLASGFMICPGEGSSVIHFVEHLDLESSSVPEMVRPFYESSEILAKKTIVSALRYIEHVENEQTEELKLVSREEPSLLRSFSQRLSRGFNDAVNCFTEDGWALRNFNVCDDVIMSIKRTPSFGLYANCDSILCLRTSLILQNVFPAILLKFFKERRSDWMVFNFAEHLVASRSAAVAFPGLDTFQRPEYPVLLGHTNPEDEALDIIRLDHVDTQFNAHSRNLYHLQMSNGMEDDGFGACSELIFAPIDKTIPNDAAQLSCGFRIFSLGSDTASFSHPSSMLIMAFQFPYEWKHQDEIKAVAQLYVQHVISSVKNISLEVAATLSGVYPEMDAPESNLSMLSRETNSGNLAKLICECYRLALGMDILGFNCEPSVSMSELIQNHQYAILCFSCTLQSISVCVYANQAALIMLQTIPENLQMLNVNMLFGGSDFSLVNLIPTIMQQGFIILPSGNSISSTNIAVLYDQCVVWRVQAPDGSYGLALAFIDWLFI